MLASVGSVGDAYDNAMAESFVDVFKTELIADRVWRDRSQLELAIVEWVAWFNTSGLKASSGTLSTRLSQKPVATDLSDASPTAQLKYALRPERSNRAAPFRPLASSHSL